MGLFVQGAQGLQFIVDLAIDWSKFWSILKLYWVGFGTIESEQNAVKSQVWLDMANLHSSSEMTLGRITIIMRRVLGRRQSDNCVLKIALERWTSCLGIIDDLSELRWHQNQLTMLIRRLQQSPIRWWHCKDLIFWSPKSERGCKKDEEDDNANEWSAVVIVVVIVRILIFVN